MFENDSFWEFYWEVRLQDIETLGKRAAIIAASRLIRRIAQETGSPVRLLELGCGEGQILGPLVEAHAQNTQGAVGIDYKRQSIDVCRAHYPAIRFIEGDFTNQELLESLGQFDLVLLVNALHEVFSDAYSDELGEVDVEDAKIRVEAAFTGAVERTAPGGYLLLFDGLEPPAAPETRLQLRFLDDEYRAHFETFAAEYRPFQITYTQLKDDNRIELSWRNFTRYITKSIFLGKALWKTERLESYQYFTEAEFRSMIQRNQLDIELLQTITVNDEKWRRVVTIETPGVDFPAEHIMMILKKPGSNYS
jgi:SAM-dependent methyltransferase